jgi:uncharacterized protein (DUF2461 family)
MKIHSDTLTANDLYAAADTAGVTLFQCDRAGSRKRRFAFEVALEGSNRYAAARDPERKGATWDEWGIFMMHLLDKDCRAIVGIYNGRADFLQKTRTEAERIATWHDPAKYQAKTHRAPWLRPMAGESVESFNAKLRRTA